MAKILVVTLSTTAYSSSVSQQVIDFATKEQADLVYVNLTKELKTLLASIKVIKLY